MSGGKKKRKAIDEGQQQYNAFAQQAQQSINQSSQQAQDIVNQATQSAVGTQAPYAAVGGPAVGAMSALSGYGVDGGPSPDEAYQKFLESPFYTGGENAFNQEMDRVDNSLAGSGLMFSSARGRWREDARNRNFSNAFMQYLNNTSNLAGIGQGAAGTQANAFANQGQLAANISTGQGANLANISTGQGGAALNTAQNKANTYQGPLGVISQIAGIGQRVGGAIGGF